MNSIGDFFFANFKNFKRFFDLFKGFLIYKLVIDRTLGSAELRPNFLPMLSQFGFPQRMSELSKFL